MNSYSLNQTSLLHVDTSPPTLLKHKKKRNIIIGCVLGALILVCVIITCIYLLVFRPRVYFGNHVLITTVQQPISSKNTPSGPKARYTLAPTDGMSNSTANIFLNNQTSCMLVTPNLETKGLAHEGDKCMIWEPLSNTYLYFYDCEAYKNNENACKNTTQSISGNSCTWSDNKTCKPSASNLSPLVFRSLPKNFKELIKDPTGDNLYIKGFLFTFSGVNKDNTCTTTCTPNKQNMLKINTNYVLQSFLTPTFIVGSLSFGVVPATNLKTKSYNDNFNWQFLK